MQNQTAEEHEVVWKATFSDLHRTVVSVEIVSVEGCVYRSVWEVTLART